MMTMLEALPTEILIQILQHLGPNDLVSISQANKLLHAAGQADSLWQQFCLPKKSYAPFESWHGMYSRVLHRWGWFEGLWCGDDRSRGIHLLNAPS